MSSINDLLAQYASAPSTPADASSLVPVPATPQSFLPNIVPEFSSGLTGQKMQNLMATSADKQAAVADASAAKKTDISGQDYTNAAAGMIYGKGADSVTGAEEDLRTMDPLNLYLKYGPDKFNEVIHGQALANTQLRNDATAQQTGGDALVDTGLGVAQGLANSVGGIAALGAGLISPELGQSGARILGRLNDTISDAQSDALNARRSVYQVKQGLDSRDNKLDLDNSDGGLIAGLSRIGKDTLDAIGNATDDASVVSDGIAQGIGSILGAGPVGRVLKAGAELVPAIAARATTHATTAAGIGLMEAGGAYQQSTDEIGQTSFEDLRKQSPAFVQMTKPVSEGGEGLEPEKARSILANRAGMLSAAIQGPLAAATGRLAADFEANPFAVVTPRIALQQAAKETIEEGSQGFTGQLAQNIATQATGANPNKDITEGVGEQTGLGALYGFGSAGVIQAPSTAVGATKTATGAVANLARSTVNGVGPIATGLANSIDLVQKAAGAVRSVAQPGVDWLAKRGDKAYRDMQDASPVSDANMQASARAVYENAPEHAEAAKQAVEQSADLTPEQKKATADYLDALSGSLDFYPDDFAGLSEGARKSVEGSTNQIEAMQKLAAFVNDEKNSPKDRFDAGVLLSQSLDAYQGYIRNGAENLTNLPADHPAYQFATGIEDLHAALEKSQGVAKAQAAMDNMANNAQTYNIVQPVDAETIDTPEGQANVKAQVALATIAPDKINPDDANVILQQAKEGNINLTPNQSAALNVAVSLVQNAREYAEKSKSEGWSKSDRTAYNLTAEEDAKDLPSVLDHARNIYRSFTSGDLDGARSSLNHLMQLATHMNGKVATINQHISSANPNKNGFRYQQLRADGSWGESKDPIGVTPTSPGSVKFARRVAGEAEYVTNVANSLAEAFSDLGVSSVAHTNLDARLTEGTIKETAEAFQNGDRKTGAVDSTPDQTVASQPTETQQNPVTKSTNNTETAAQPEQSEGQFQVGQQVIWANKDHDIPVVYQGNDQLASDGNTYAAVTYNGKPSFVNKAELRAVAEQKAAPVQTVQEPEVVSEPKTVAEAYPRLQSVDGQPNFFQRAFGLPNTKRSNTQGTENPIAEVHNALESNESLASFSGSKSLNNLTPEVARGYQTFMSYAREIVKALNKTLRDDINNAKTKSNGFLVPENAKALSSQNGKSFNIVETLPNGQIRYNPELIQNAVLAGLQWVLTTHSRGANLDNEDIGKILGIDAGEVTGEMNEAFNTSLTTNESLRTMADKITKYWGLTENRNEYDGFVKGIPASIAAEVLRTFEDSGLVKTETQYFNVIDQDGKPATREINFTSVNLEDTDYSKKLTEVLMQYPSAIDDAVMTEPEERVFTGEQRPPIAKSQMRNPEVRNTPEQLDVIKNVQNTPYRLHMPMVNFFNYIGADGVRDLFGEGDLTTQALNKNDREAREGRNRSFVSAFQALTNLQADLENRLTDEDGDIAKTDIFYAFNFSRVDRLQMLGSHNPQASKLMREAVLPTGTEIDMNDPAMRTGFYLGLAQALGIKIHNMPHEASIELLAKDLAGKYAPAVQVFRDFHSTDVLSDDAVQILRNAGLTSPVAVQAISEYARLRNNEGNMFSTPMYVEADGVTNGIANATQMLSSGQFTMEYLLNSQRTGLFFGSDHTTLNTYRQADPTDLYKATGNDLTVGLNTLKRNLAGQPDVLLQFNSLQGLMDMFLPGAALDDQGNLNIDRGVTKNPLTITVYGSSAFGIAGNITDALVNEIYAAMSAASQRQAANPELSFEQAMFGEGGEGKFQALVQYLGDLTSNEARFSTKKQSYYTQAVNPAQGDVSSPENFTISTEERNAIRANVNSLFIRPMIDSITKTVGQSVMQNMTDVRQAVQAISIFQQHAFQQAVKEAVAENKASDPVYNAHFLLSQNEQNKILKGVLEAFPTINTGTQSFFVGGANNGYTTKSTIGRSRDDRYRTLATMYGPTDAGVGGAAYLNIGMGDGQMIQTGFAGRNGVKRALPVFDGVNLPIDRLTRDSQALNAAVFSSWNQNPVAEVLKALDVAIKNMGEVEISQPMLDQLSRTFLGQTGLLSNNAAAMQFISDLRDRMELSSRSIDARHSALRQFELHIDQMASMAAPHQNAGEKLPADPAAAVARLNQAYAAAMKGEAPVAPKQEGPKASNLGIPSSGSKARQISMNMLNNLVKSLGLTGVKKAMFDEIRRSAAAKGYKIITGTRDELLAYNFDNGNKHDASNFTNMAVDGFISPASKEIYIANATAQTLLHEMIHASTFETVLNHYQGNTTPEITQAVTAIEGMMQQFRGLDPFSMDSKTRADFEDAKASITSALSNGDLQEAGQKAAALNEFMAWSLATQSLNKTLEKTPILKRITDAVFNAIRKLVYGRKRIPAAPGDDILSNLMFHTGVIVRGQASVQNVSADTKLYQSRVYGNDSRLQQLNDTFDSVVTAHINEAPNVFERSARQTEVNNALILGNDVGNSFINHGFPMNMQQATTFSMIVSALATQAHIDPASMNYAQDLYDHVISKLNLGHFLPEGPVTQQQEYDATEKFNSIMGRYFQGRDGVGRTTLLPAFLALSMVDDGFRDVLKEIGLPENQKGDGTLDGTLETFGTNMLDNLGRRMAGAPDSKNVREAVDALTNRIMDVASNRETFIDQYAGPLGDIVDRANEIVSEGLDSLAEKVWDAADNVKAKTNNKAVNALASVSKLMTAIVNEDKAGIIAEGISSMINRLNGLQPLRDVIADMVGRSASNQNVYDLIKRFRTAIQQDRQQFRDVLPGIIASKFSRDLSDNEWSTLHHALAKTDIVSLFQHFNGDEINALMKDGRTLRGKITAIENRIDAGASKKHAALIKSKAQQLAYFMMGGEPGRNLLRNAEAIGRLLGETDTAYSSTTDMVKDIDSLTSLYAIEQLTREQKDTVFSLVQNESEGMNFVMSYLKGQRAEEQRKIAANPRAKFNGYKGYIPEIRDSGVTLIVADDSESARLESMSLKRIGDYQGSSAEPGKTKRGYYFGNVQSRTLFNQGLMQNVRQTANGVDASTGYTQNTLAGRITDRATVKTITTRLKAGETGESLLPVYNDRGQVVAYERSLDRNIQAKTNPSDHLAKMIGVWRGRQVEEVKGNEYNKVLIDTLADMYNAEIKQTPSKQAEYVDIFNDKLDPVLADAVSLMPSDVRAYARSVFGDSFYVRKDLLNDTFGYREATVGDAWTGNARWSPETLNTAKRVAMGMFGADAYRLATKAESVFQNFVQDARTLIIVKSVIVPFQNAVANVFQLVGRGVPLKNIVSGVPRKLAEINTYVKTRAQEVEAEADLRAATDTREQRRLTSKIQAFQDSYRRMSIWPLLEAGEFSAIHDASIGDTVELTSGKLNSYIEQQVDKLPKSLQTAGRYALVTKDTALFKALEKSVEYGDFVAKAILFDDITRRQRKTTDQALAAITEEFINYDRLPGRFRGYMEKSGLLWFYNYKVRAVKIALSTIRNNPVHALLAGALAAPDMFGNVGSPVTDNLITQFADGGLSHSVGMGQAFHAPFLNPWVNLAF